MIVKNVLSLMYVISVMKSLRICARWSRYFYLSVGIWHQLFFRSHEIPTRHERTQREIFRSHSSAFCKAKQGILFLRSFRFPKLLIVSHQNLSFCKPHQRPVCPTGHHTPSPRSCCNIFVLGLLGVMLLIPNELMEWNRRNLIIIFSELALFVTTL